MQLPSLCPRLLQDLVVVGGLVTQRRVGVGLVMLLHVAVDVGGAGGPRFIPPHAVLDHDAAVVAFPLLGEARQLQTAVVQRGGLAGLGVDLADHEVEMMVLSVSVRHDNDDPIGASEGIELTASRFEHLLARRCLAGRPRRHEVCVRIAQLPAAV